jgi:hypothetical protein
MKKKTDLRFLFADSGFSEKHSFSVIPTKEEFCIKNFGFSMADLL